MLKIKTDKQTDKTKQNKTKQTNKQNKTTHMHKKNIIMCIKHAPRILVFLVSVLELKYFVRLLQFIPYSLLLQELDIKNLRELEVMCLI